MKKIMILLSVVIVGLIGCGCVQHGAWIPALVCTGYLFFVLGVNCRKPKRKNNRPGAATRGPMNGNEPVGQKRPIYTYSNIRGGWRQDFNERWYA